MKYRPRIYYTETDKALMWDRWQKGDSLHSIEICLAAIFYLHGHPGKAFRMNSNIDSIRKITRSTEGASREK
jgi:hypothetical protein